MGVDGEGGVDFRADDLGSVDFGQLLDVASGRDAALERHIARCTQRAEVGFRVIGGEDAILDVSPNEAVRLTIPVCLLATTLEISHKMKNVHRLWAQRSSHQEHLSPSSLFPNHLLRSRTPLCHLHLDSSVFLRSVALAILTIVVHARLAILRAVNRVPLAELDFAKLVQLVDLPPHEGVVVGIRGRGQEGSAPVDTRSKRVVVLLENKDALGMGFRNTL